MSANAERQRNFLIGLAIGISTGYLTGRFIARQNNSGKEADLQQRGFSGTLKEYHQREEKLNGSAKLLDHIKRLEEKK